MCEFSPRCKVGSHSRGGTCPVTGRQGGTPSPTARPGYSSSFRQMSNENRPSLPPTATVNPTRTPRPREAQLRKDSTQRPLAIVKKRLSENGGNLLSGWIFEPASIFSVAAEELLAVKNRSVRHRWRRKHWLCRVLWKAAESLDGAQLSGLLGDSVRELCMKAGIPIFAAKIIGRSASNIIDSSLPGSAKQVADFVRVVVALVCPHTDKCSYGCQAINFLLKPEVEATLKVLAATEQA